MYIKQLDVFGLRNVVEARLFPGPGVNIIHGANGSGKTSLLEAIYLLGRGRSFRTRQLKSIINHGIPHCTVFGLLNQDGQGADGRGTPIGIARDKAGDFTYKIAGQPVRAASALAEILPLQLLNSQSFALLEGSPGRRRQFIDWGVFHVEHAYQDTWRRFQRCLNHRNALVRHVKMAVSELEIWDGELAELSSRVTEHRAQYLELVIPLIEELVAEFPAVASNKLSFSFRQGWEKGKRLEDVLRDDWARDRLAGTTHHGPHRADLVIRCGAVPASDVLSRGQIKVLIIAMLLAQGYLFRQLTGKGCVYLLDDLGAELDKENLRRIAALLRNLDVQVFVTGTELPGTVALWSGGCGKETRVFHVEQGKVAPQQAV